MTKQDEFVELEEFPGYAVSRDGIFLNLKRGGYQVNPSFNQQGLPKITLIQNGRPQTRSAAVLVARTFLPEPEEPFDTVIHLNGDRRNCSVENLAWRPRWFAIAYHRQFEFEDFYTNYGHYVDLDTRVQYNSLYDLVIDLGVYYNDVLQHIENGKDVFPIWHRFATVED